jgi:hypothetical protein
MKRLQTYKGYKITTQTGPAPDYSNPTASVFDEYNPRGATLYKTTSLDKAIRWIDAYIVGEQWAVDEALKQRITRGA